MTIHHINGTKLHILEGDDWREVDLARPVRIRDDDLVREVEQRIATMRTMRAESDEYQKMMDMDKVFDDERVKQRMRELDHLFIYGNSTYSTPPAGYLGAYPTPTGPVIPMPTYPQINSLLQGLLSRLK